MALRVRVCGAAEIGAGEMRAVAVPGVTVPILVVNLDGEFLAVTSRCPHEDVSLAGGKRKHTRIICPAHGYQFDLRSGACSHDPALRLQRYRVAVIDGDIYVDLIGLIGE